MRKLVLPVEIFSVYIVQVHKCQLYSKLFGPRWSNAYEHKQCKNRGKFEIHNVSLPKIE